MKKTLAILFCVLLVSCFAPVAMGEEPVKNESIEMESIDNTRLAAGYIDQILSFNSRRTSRGAVLVAERLSDGDRLIYNILVSHIRSIAAGEEESSILKFGTQDFTAEQLGVESIYDANGDLAYDAINSFFDILQAADFHSIFDCINADCPYDLYWATGGASLATEGYDMCVRMPVSAEYQKEDAEEPQYTVDSAKYGVAVAQARNNASRIVAENEGLTDYYRLEAYKDAICDLTSYNFEAAARVNKGGNPWELIWALDDNPDTEVVCEGYSKAFKYLNDLSSSSVPVYLASGNMLLNGSGGAHMWNIVRMDDGRNYLVDVTNCDGEGIGAPDLLFIVPFESGSVAEGYSFPVNGGQTITYVYIDTIYTEEEKTISSEAYVQPVKPEAPVYAISSETGLVGYSLAVRFDEAVEKVHERYSETLYDVEGNYLLIPLTEAGETSFSFAAEANGVLSEYGETLTVQVLAIDNNTVTIPGDTEIIESEAFRGTDAEIVVIPTSVHQIGDYAFADMMNLKAVRLESPNTIVSDTAFDGSAEYMELAAENELDDYWFDVQRPFLVQ